jgi:hypothetical protein
MVGSLLRNHAVLARAIISWDVDRIKNPNQNPKKVVKVHVNPVIYDPESNVRNEDQEQYNRLLTLKMGKHVIHEIVTTSPAPEENVHPERLKEPEFVMLMKEVNKQFKSVLEKDPDLKKDIVELYFGAHHQHKQVQADMKRVENKTLPQSRWDKESEPPSAILKAVEKCYKRVETVAFYGREWPAERWINLAELFKCYWNASRYIYSKETDFSSLTNEKEGRLLNDKDAINFNKHQKALEESQFRGKNQGQDMPPHAPDVTEFTAGAQ